MVFQHITNWSSNTLIPKVLESCTGDASQAPPSSDPSTEAYVDPTATADPPPSTSSDSSLRAMLDTVMIVQAAHGQLLLDVLNEVAALQAALADARGSPSPAPHSDESWLPFSNTSQKGGVHMEIGGDFIDCIYEFLDMFFDVFILYGLYILGGDIMFMCLVFFLFLVSHMVHWLLIYIMRLFMVYVFYFMFCEIKKFTLFYLYFPYMHLCVCWVFQEFIG